MAKTVTVKIENTYSDGHESTNEVELEAPDSLDDLEDWWDDVVQDHTGDGHGADNDLGYCYEATIIAGPGKFVGQTNEWSGS